MSPRRSIPFAAAILIAAASSTAVVATSAAAAAGPQSGPHRFVGGAVGNGPTLEAAEDDAVLILNGSEMYTCFEPYTFTDEAQHTDGTWTVIVEASCISEI
jgi:hypothetical protein